MKLKEIVNHKIFKEDISVIDTDSPCLINTINAHSFCLLKKDNKFNEALKNSDILLPDGFGIVLAGKILSNKKVKKIAGFDIHQYLLKQANSKEQKVFYLGSATSTLHLIEKRIQTEYPNISVKSYSPPYKTVFSNEDTNAMITAVNTFKPDVLFIGMTAPKQEKWVQENRDRLDANIITSIGAVFDFYAGTVKRAPNWMVNNGLEWFYRFVKEPKRMWKRYLVNNTKFLFYVFQEKHL